MENDIDYSVTNINLRGVIGRKDMQVYLHFFDNLYSRNVNKTYIVRS